MVSVSIAYSTGDRQAVSMGPKAMIHCEGPCFFCESSFSGKEKQNPIRLQSGKSWKTLEVNQDP